MMAGDGCDAPTLVLLSSFRTKQHCKDSAKLTMFTKINSVAAPGKTCVRMLKVMERSDRKDSSAQSLGF